MLRVCLVKYNCWEFVKCGREPGGNAVAADGICPAATEHRLDGVHDGHNAGRACWILPDTNCDRGTGTASAHRDKLARCASCKFFHRVADEEGSALCSTNELTMRLSARLQEIETPVVVMVGAVVRR